jgi:DNA processing protein
VQLDGYRDGALRTALVPGFTPRLWRRFLHGGGEPDRLARAHPGWLRARLRVDRATAGRLARSLARTDVAGELARVRAAGARLLFYGCPDYPPPLSQLPDPPPVLFARGEWLETDLMGVALCGLRRPSRYGTRVARTLAGDLARSGVTIVGGLGHGTEAEACAAALDGSGRVVAFLGSGHNDPYPPEHVPLLERIVERGAVFSEFAMDAPPRPGAYARRVRLVAAFARATVVVEAGMRGGALATVEQALDLGRPVMAVPGRVDRAESAGTLRMLRDGAAPVGSAEDVFAALGWCLPARTDLDAEERRVLAAVEETGATPAMVAQRLAMPEEAAAAYLMTLEMRGLVERAGGRWLPS